MQRQETTEAATYVLVVDNDWDTRGATRPLVVPLERDLPGMTGTELVPAVLRDGR